MGLGRKLAVVAVLLVVVMAGTGCGTYWKDRGNDAADIFNVGVTTSSEAGFAFYVGLLNVLTLGYSNVDGTIYGLAERDVGAIPMRMDTWGLLLYGDEQVGYGEAVPLDPDYPDPYKVGVAGLIVGPRPYTPYQVNCPKFIHLGWVGLTLTCNLGQLADFLVGFTTADIMGDDAATRERRAAEEAGAGEVEVEVVE